MKHNILVLFAGCGAWTAVGFAGSHVQTARAAVQLTPARAEAPVAVVIALDGSRSVATCVATACVTAPCVTATCVTTPCVAVACCDPNCDRKQGHAAPSVVRVSTGSNGQVVVCGSGGGALSVCSGSGQSTFTSSPLGGGSNGSLMVVGQGVAHSHNGVLTVASAPGQASAGPLVAGHVVAGQCAAGSGSCSAGPCSVGSGASSAGQGSCSAGPLSGSCNSIGAGVVSAGHLHGNLVSLTGPSLPSALTVVQAPSLVAHNSTAAHSVDLGELVQGLRGSVGALVVQNPNGADSDDAPRALDPEGSGMFEGIEAPDMPELADVEDMDAPDMDDDSGNDDMAPDVAWSSDSWKEEVEQALQQARAQMDGADAATREALEQAQEEMVRAQSGWSSGDAQREYKKAMEEAQVDWNAALEESTRAQARAGAEQRSALLAQARAQGEQSQERQERMKTELRAMQDGQQKRAKAGGEARGSFQKRSSDDAGLEARVEALERLAKASGREVSGNGSLESRVAELERTMRSQGEGQARAPHAARVLEVPRAGMFTTPEKMKRFEFARPATPRAAPRVTAPPTPPTPAMPRTAAPKLRAGGLGKMQGMDEGTRRDLERAMSDLRREADRLREEMSKLRSEVERLPRDSSR